MLRLKRKTRAPVVFKIFSLFVYLTKLFQNREIQLFLTQQLKIKIGLLIPFKALIWMNLREKMFLIQTVFKSHFSNEPFYKLYFKLLTQLCY